MSRLLVRRPSPRLAEGELTHLERVPVDPELAQRQWEAYVEVYRSLGWDVIDIDPDDAHADGVFVEDTVVMFGDLALLTRPGADSRRGEIETTRAALEKAGIEYAAIEAPGTLDGGDVLKVGRTVYVGQTLRTNAEAVRQMDALLAPRGWTVVPVEVTKVLHLKSGVTALPDGTVIGYPPLVDDASIYPEFLAVPEEHGTAVVVLDDDTVLMSSDAPQSAQLFRDRGLTVIETPISEFEKLEGCVTCLSVRVRD
ncbi:dimethylargininase [Microbacterium azadirachtae]|uniref:N(G),N(G)-dimethylarginine dimethylaminohydrolase n=1 Tax=Microbacterium azadirachtae TaxID=582680 RepID=A0A0F0LMN7_9MICO|nr:dimethylargininase [Microbacterium azadirachtae]KJL32791.1 N(G),N(G)-dimethylarginine dimethylaminohydrolase [Microbacterium azadirachtae]UXW86278.1 N(G),N(G)-dimethylarginine dimethylaminohydrolase [Microbacterium azadirachtae]SDL57738.1 dimethylargininase [Microbacterium azadirachtae]SEF86589.1 dimethylargininase [Microbacterium azadirachtae]SEF88459.1 dimethylargininase [Microbacterium azadirachtae]